MGIVLADLPKMRDIIWRRARSRTSSRLGAPSLYSGCRSHRHMEIRVRAASAQDTASTYAALIISGVRPPWGV
ncbi:MAG: hypothetical protein JWO52_5783 [Gammaproteobacteria bacterium]|nr:hypothetical protein [Gammaproteobacteria bacterium]